LKIHLPHIKTRYHVHDVSNEVIAIDVKKKRKEIMNIFWCDLTIFQLH
jgi:hypothetical protein